MTDERDRDAHRHPITDEIRHALDWSSPADPELTHYVHAHPHAADHGEPVDREPAPVH